MNAKKVWIIHGVQAHENTYGGWVINCTSTGDITLETFAFWGFESGLYCQAVCLVYLTD